MAITQLRLSRFKCFADSQEIDLAPLTVVYGRNNSGKSSIPQSLMILRQTIDQPHYGGTLNLDGPLHDAGSFTDLCHRHQSTKAVGFKLRVEDDDLPTTEIDIQFTADEPNPPRLKQLRITPEGIGSVVVRRSVGHGGPYELLIAGRTIGKEEDANFLFSVNSFFPTIGDEPARVGRPSEARKRSRQIARRALELLSEDLQSARFLGAFRSAPKRRYEYKGIDTTKPDLSGVSTPAALYHDQVGRHANRTLVKIVNRWLFKLADVSLVPVRRATLGRARLFELELRTGAQRKAENLADVGCGIGQALPVFVEGLRTPAGGLFVVQEPEIHLHPDAQLYMADFLLELAASGRRVVAETHSENFLLRMRRAMLRPGDAELAGKDISILHVEKLPQGSSRVKNLALNRLAQQIDWPADFMQDASRERMALLEDTAQKVEELEKNNNKE